MSKRPIAIDVVADFGIDELFFSRTDRRGVIDFGNDVFVRVSGYPPGEILGRPHNLIRHPDMPKVMFKLFWDTLQAGNPIVAYVKNMTSEGTYYWVLAAVFPTDTGYLSIRLKPSSPIFSLINDLYSKMHKAEVDRAPETAWKLLDQFVSQQGFRSYEDFMTSALVNEIQARDAALQNRRREYFYTAEEQPNPHDLRKICSRCAGQLSNVFDRLKVFSKTFATFTREQTVIREACLSITDHAAKMSAAADAGGADAAGLTPLTREIASIVKTTEAAFERFSAESDLAQSVRSTELRLASIRLQLDMIAYFVANETDQVKVDTQAKQLLKLAVAHLRDVDARIDRLASSLTVYMSQSRDLRKNLRALRLLCNASIIETARTTSGFATSFNPQIKRFSDYIDGASEAANRTESDVKDLLGSLGIIVDFITHVRERISDAVAIVDRVA